MMRTESSRQLRSRVVHRRPGHTRRAVAATLGVLGAVGCASARGRSGGSPGTRAELRHAIDSMVAQPKFSNAHWGILIVDPERGDTLYSHNAGKLFMPASNQKLLTAAIAMSHLGPDFVWRTPVLLRGQQRG